MAHHVKNGFDILIWMYKHRQKWMPEKSGRADLHKLHDLLIKEGFYSHKSNTADVLPALRLYSETAMYFIVRDKNE